MECDLMEINPGHGVTLENFLFPMRLMYNISKEEFNTFTGKYNG